uniref:Uncharacterized protein n=1 Tax=Nelumbo nucifera TaxID=4432 RepID=A0A822XLR2_NELNU|nr:TPA_asm: hypothetical protein HUJ06_021594 [Nelumbo nucifera]DAD44887.1 TPA_asm: hypothetical protein HUJ06_003117 [Nelumbo nucifera]
MLCTADIYFVFVVLFAFVYRASINHKSGLHREVVNFSDLELLFQ